MASKEHDFMVGIKRIDDNIFLALSIHGKLTHEDYERFVPMVENIVKDCKEAKISVLADAREFAGWELEAAWDDFKFSIKHFNKFDRIAIVGNRKWEEFVVKLSNLWTPYEIHFFEDYDEAVEWVKG
jgi:hypothetical protein